MNSGAHSACLWKWFDLFEVKYVHGSWGFNKLSPSRLWPNLQAWGYHWVEKWGFFHPTLHFLGEIIQLCCFFWIHLVWHNMTIPMLASLRMMQWLKILWCWAYLLRETTWSLRGFISLGRRRNICTKFMKVIITVWEPYISFTLVFTSGLRIPVNNENVGILVNRKEYEHIYAKQSTRGKKKFLCYI